MTISFTHLYALLHLFRKGLRADAAPTEMTEVYGDDAPSQATAYRWFKRFKSSDFDMEDKQRSGRPSKLNDEELKKIVEEEPKTSVRELALKLQEPQTTVYRHLVKLGKVSKLGAWVPHELSEKNKADRLRIAELLYTRFETNPELFDRVLTCDESWILHKNVTRKQQWVDKDAIPSPTAKPGLHPKKVLHIVFWDSEGVVHHENIPARTTINAVLYSEILERVAEKMKEVRPSRNPKEILFIHDKARPHTAKTTKATLKKLKWEVMPHPPYSPDMSPCDLFLFRSLKNVIKGQEVASREEVTKWVDKFYGSKPSSLFKRGINKLKDQWEGVIEFEGDYAVE